MRVSNLVWMAFVIDHTAHLGGDRPADKLSHMEWTKDNAGIVYKK